MNYFTRLFFFFFALLAVATAAPKPSKTTSAPPPAQTCSTGAVQCCQTVEAASSSSASLILALLGIVLDDLSVLVGLTCSPITAIGIGGTSCSAQTVCCENDSFNGLIAIGCTPINIGL